MEQLPAEIMWNILVQSGPPLFVYKHLVLVCQSFWKLIQSRPIGMLVNIDITCDDQIHSIIQLPESIKVLDEFKMLQGYSIALTRNISIHESAITDEATSFVSYMNQLVKRTQQGVLKSKIIYGTVQFQGKRNGMADVLAKFIQVLKPQSFDMWHWDAELLEALASKCPPCLQLPNMKTDGHLTVQDFGILAKMKGLTRLDLFRPFPRSPWGIEATAFSALTLLPLKALSIASGRLIQRSLPFKEALLELNHLQVLDLRAWNLDIHYSTKVLLLLREMTWFQFVHVTSPDFWNHLPSYYRINEGIGKHAIKKLRHLGLHYMQPEVSDFAVMIEGIIRCLPKLHTLTVRVYRPTDSDYDLFSIPKATMERLLVRLDAQSDLTEFVFEIASHMWSSRKSYADELMNLQTKMRIRVTSPLVVRGSAY